jgi:benzylsuccinate CoA-transferase BbsE subunit
LHDSSLQEVQPRWLDRKWRNRPEARAEFKPLFEAFTRDLTRDELVENALKRRIVMSAVNRVRDVLDDPQLAYRDYFVRLDGDGPLFPGAPYKMSEPVWRPAPAPALGEHDALVRG